MGTGKMNIIFLSHKEKIIKNTFVRMHELHSLKIIILTICVCFPSVSFCEEKVKSYDAMNAKGVLSEPNKTIVPEGAPQERFIGHSDCIEYKRNVQTVDDKNEGDISISTVIKIFSLLLAFLMALFTAFSVFIGFTSWQTQSSYKEEVARAREAAEKAEKILKDIEEKGSAAIEDLTKFISTTIMIEGYLSIGKVFALQLSTATNLAKINAILSEERDLLRFIVVYLKKLSEKLTIAEKIRYRTTLKQFLKEAQDIKAYLKRGKFGGMMQNLIDTCDEIIKILEALTAKPENST